MIFKIFYSELRHTRLYYFFSKLKYEKYLKNEYNKIVFDNKELTDLNHIAKLSIKYSFETNTINKTNISQNNSLNIVLSSNFKQCLEDFRSYNYNKSLVNSNQILKENKVLKQLNIFTKDNEFIDEKNELFNELKSNDNEFLQALIYIKFQTAILLESYLVDEALVLNLLEKNLLDFFKIKHESESIEEKNNLLLFIKKRLYENKLDYKFFTFPINNNYSNLFNSIFRYSKVANLLKDEEMSAKVEYYLIRICLSINFFRNASVHVNKILNIIKNSNSHMINYEDRLFKDLGLQINGFLSSFNEGHKDDNKIYFSYYRKKLLNVLKSFLKNNEIANNFVVKSCLTLPEKRYLAKHLANNLNDLDIVTQNSNIEITTDINDIEIVSKVCSIRALGILLDLDLKLFKVNEMYKRIFIILKEFEESKLNLNFLRNTFIKNYEIESLLNPSLIAFNTNFTITTRFPIDQTEIIKRITKYLSVDHVGNNYIAKLMYEMMFWNFFSLKIPKYMNISLKKLSSVSSSKIMSIQSILKLIANKDYPNIKIVDLKEYPFSSNNKKTNSVSNINSEALMLSLQKIALACEEKSLSDVFFNYRKFLDIHKEYFGEIDTEILKELKHLLYCSQYSIVLKRNVTKKDTRLV